MPTPAPSYEQPYPQPPYDPYGQQPYAPAARAGTYPPQSYDTGMTQVFGPGALHTEDHFADSHTMATGVIPAYDDDFSRSATARIDFGPHEAFGPPPEDVEPEPEPDAAHVFSRLRRIRSHAREKRKRGRGWVGVVVVLVLFAAAAGVRFAPFSPWYYQAGDESELMAVPSPFHPTSITAADVGTEGFLSWAYKEWQDDNGSVVGSDNLAETTESVSMITAWFAADLLRRSAEEGAEPSETDRADIESMIRDDDLTAAERVVASLGGHEASITRLTTMCRLSETQSVAGDWAATVISAQDAARLGGCLADGNAAGAEWTPWLLNVMKQVRGPGNFGIREAFPSEQQPSIAIKNGVMLDETTGEWRANCLAIGDGWALAVLQRYPSTGDITADLAHVDAVCQEVVWKLTG